MESEVFRQKVTQGLLKQSAKEEPETVESLTIKLKNLETRYNDLLIKNHNLLHPPKLLRNKAHTIKLIAIENQALRKLIQNKDIEINLLKQSLKNATRPAETASVSESDNIKPSQVGQ